MTTAEKQTAVLELYRQLEQLPRHDYDRAIAFRARCEEVARLVFEDGNDYLGKLRAVSFWPAGVAGRVAVIERAWNNGCSRCRTLLEAMLAELGVEPERYWAVRPRPAPREEEPGILQAVAAFWRWLLTRPALWLGLTAVASAVLTWLIFDAVLLRPRAREVRRLKARIASLRDKLRDQSIDIASFDPELADPSQPHVMLPPTWVSAGRPVRADDPPLRVSIAWWPDTLSRVLQLDTLGPVIARLALKAPAACTLDLRGTAFAFEVLNATDSTANVSLVRLPASTARGGRTGPE